MKLTNEMHDAVKNSPVGQLIDRLIREEFMRGGNTRFDGGGSGNVIQALWAAFMSACDESTEDKAEIERLRDEIKRLRADVVVTRTMAGFREIKQDIKSYASSGNGSAISGE